MTAATAPTAGAQELPLKREIPGADPFRCPAWSPPEAPDAQERSQATRLGSNAEQAVILGDRERARDLLARATELDPTSSDLAYRHGRILQELGDGRGAVTWYCRSLALEPEANEAADSRARVEQLSSADRPEVPSEALGAFRTGVSAVDAGRLEAAADAFSRAVTVAPEWAEAVYDRGVTLARLGRREEALEALRGYLELRPDAPDAMAVSERIGQLRNVGILPSPATALTLGALLPGMGQFYSGRTLGGLTVLSLAAGSVAAALLIEDVHVKCYD
ncbi:MAG TPA: tetratricopeptide repeat protein, partial [Longimicrobiales bacterium]|nr:tetratricopeptide repeat protein [Longimicrobiales bacterium]